MHYKKSVFRSLALVTQLGLSVLTPVFLCVFAGYQLDFRFGTKTLIPLLVLGILAGAKCAWDLTRNILRQEKADEEAERRERMQNPARSGTEKPKQPSRIRKKESD
ncbi:MAG: AtpZ/AtpI family protein [Lachnospiraceae bacterium]